VIADGVSIVLASASPRRSELLLAAGFQFTVRVADVDESVAHGESADAYVLRLAMEKARAVTRTTSEVVIGADTTVVVDGEILGKPVDAADATRMLRRLSGRSHRVLTGVCVLYDEVVDARVGVTEVEFMPLDQAEIAWYVGTGEPMDKAGAYGIQGRGSRFIARVAGSYPNVVGLPVGLVYDMLKRLVAHSR
jgi:septum formation protein